MDPGVFVAGVRVIFTLLMASERFVDFITRRKPDDGQLNDSVKSGLKVLKDAEEKGIGNETQEHLDDLKNALFEAADLLDEIDYQENRLKREDESRCAVAKARQFLRPRKSFKRKILKTSKVLEQKLKTVKRMKDRHARDHEESRQSLMASTLVKKSDIIGREGDQEAIMKELLSDDGNRRNNLSIITIAGLGGMGKSTLAKVILKDKRVRNRFDVTARVKVSKKFDVVKITRDIATELARMACDGKNLKQIQVELNKKLTKKRFLLVLDDVWNVNSYIKYWEPLLRPLKSGGPGSTIIVITCNDFVATSVHSSLIIRLRKLDSTYCWQLFCKYAFGDKNPRDYPHLKEIGKKIVKECDGFPLALKEMGDVLRRKLDASYWRKVLENNLRKYFKDDILPALRSSYHRLPWHLKQCFAYCSIFPKDYNFKKEQVILLWMAEGFLMEEGNKTMEETGEEYFEELVSRSFFQPFGESFAMYSLINDLAREVAGDFCFRFENQNNCRPPKCLRYFSCVAVKEESSPQQLLRTFKPCHLRTFLPLNNRKWELKEMLPDLFRYQQRLRVLSLSGQNLVDLPGSISHLKQHLRYLDLSFTSIESLPECLCSFYNLQTLNLRSCQKLAKLPTKMGRLINLRHLDIRGTKLEEMPLNMGKLINLQTLTDFFVGKRKGCGVKELGSLQQLGGTLRIHNFQHVVNAVDASEAKIKLKTKLKELRLYWKADTGNLHDQKVVLDGLQPHTEIEIISINGYGGTSFPNWLKRGALLCLKELSVINCPNLKGALPMLPSLTKLVIESLPSNLARLTSLRELYISKCPKILSLREELPPTLMTLNLYNLENLKSVKGLCHLTSLESLIIDRCRYLEKLPEEGLPSSLSYLKIRRCGLQKKWYERGGKYCRQISHIQNINIRDD